MASTWRCGSVLARGGAEGDKSTTKSWSRCVAPRFEVVGCRAYPATLKVPLLHHERQPWSIWFGAVGLDYRDVGQGPRYSDQNLLYPGGCRRPRSRLVRASLVEADLKSGRLVRLFSRSVPTKYSYFIVYPPGSAEPRENSRVPTVAARAGPIGRAKGCPQTVKPIMM